MKTAKIVFTLLLINVFFALPHKAMAQASDVLTVYGEECSGVNAIWEFSFAHSATETPKVSVTQFVLSIDTTNQTGFPDVRFGSNDVQAPASNKDWSTGTDNTQDNIFWCADQNQSAFIRPGQKDSFFEFQLVPNPNNPNANIFGYPITINWTANFASENGQGDPCANVQFISSGSFIVEDFPWTGNCLDTVTATSSTPGCDPLFNLTVHNKNSTQIPIDGMIFYTNEFAGTMRPSDIQAPPGWTVNSVTQGSVTFGYTSGAAINPGQSLSGFIIGLRADPTATSFAFPWAATSQGTIIDEDTVWNVPATVPQCSENGSSDTLFISNNSKCSFEANLENFHAGSAGDTVSPITAFILSTPTPGVTFATATLPSFPWAKGWADSGIGTNKLTFYVPSRKYLYGQPGGITAGWGFSLDNNALDTPAEIINWQTVDSISAISSGSDTIHCAFPGGADKVVVSVLNGCEYMLVLTNTHTPATSLEGLAIQMPIANGTIPFAKGTYSGPAGWTPSGGNGIRFQTKNSSDFLGIGASDTFFFTISPNTPGASWPLTVLTFKGGTGDQLTDSVINNVQGCTPTPVLVCDTVTETVDSVNCGAVFTVNNRRTNAIDRVVVMPAFSSGRFINPAIPIPTFPWHDTVAQNGDSVVFVGSSIEPNGAPVSFAVSFNSGKPHQKFPVAIRTYSNGVECTTIDTMECEGTASVGPTAAPAPDLALTVVPNPLNSRSDIGFTLGSFSSVDLVLVDILGRTQSTLFSGTLSSGDHTLPLDASTLAPGTYYVRLEAEGQRVTKKIVVEH